MAKRLTVQQLVEGYKGLAGTNDDEDAIVDANGEPFVIVYTRRALASQLARRCPSAIESATDEGGTVCLHMRREAFRGLQYAFRLESDEEVAGG